MTSSTHPTLKVKLPCDDELDFQHRFAPSIAQKGLFVPAVSLHPVGATVVLRIELKSGRAVIADALVARHGQQARRKGMSLTLTRLHPESLQFPLAAPPSVAEQVEELGPSEFEIDEPASAPAPAAPSKEIEQLFDVPSEIPDDVREDNSRAVDPGERSPAPEPPTTASPLRSFFQSRRNVVLASAVGAGVLLGGVLFFVALRPSPRARPPVDRVAVELELAQQRMAAGRLAGPSRDEALDHLLAAKALAAEDPRVLQQLAALADRFEAEGEKALAGGDPAEAATHLEAALIADPSRTEASRKLQAIEDAVRGGTAKRSR